MSTCEKLNFNIQIVKFETKNYKRSLVSNGKKDSSRKSSKRQIRNWCSRLNFLQLQFFLKILRKKTNIFVSLPEVLI